MGQLFGQIDSAFAAPTPPQAEYLRELREEAGQARTTVATFLSSDLPKLNQALTAASLPPVTAPQLAAAAAVRE